MGGRSANSLKSPRIGAEQNHMPTIIPRFLRRLAPLTLALALLALPAAAPAIARAADPGATQNASAADPATDATDEQGAPDDEDAADAPDDGTSGDDCDTKSLKQAEPDEPDEVDAEPSDADFRSCDGAGAAPSSSSVAATLRAGKLDGGTVRITGPGSIEQTLTLPGKTKVKGSRIVLGKAKRNVTKAGKVRMTITLTKAGKAKLKRAKGKVTVTLTTKVKVRGAKARTTTRKMTLKGA